WVFGKSLKYDALVNDGVGNWQKALSKFQKHETTQSHKDSVVCWKSYKASLSQGNVVEQIEAAKRNNKGNFRECMTLLEKLDPFLQKYMLPSNTTYLSCSSQNEMIECCSQEVTATIVSEMRESKMYAIMADEARDGKTEQMALCVRYMSFDAASITAAIVNQLQEKGIDQLKCVAQTYDGAAVMRGAVGGVQAHFQKQHPEVIYVHCYPHELNLVLWHTCRAVSEATELFNMLESVHSFFSKLGLEQRELVQLSNTRWACQLRSVTAVLENFTAIIECLCTVNTPVAVGLKAKLSKFSFVYLLFVFQDLLSVTAGLHRYLQKETIDIIQAPTYKDAVTKTLKQKRSDATAADLHARAKAICEANQIAVWELSSGQRQKTKRMDGFVVESTCGAGSEVCGSSDLSPNFNSYFMSKDHNLKWMKLVFIFGKNQDSELAIKSCIRMRTYKVTGENYDFLIFLKDMELDSAMPQLYKLLSLVATIGAASAGVERSFTCLKRLKSYTHNTMGQSCLSSLALLPIERTLVKSLEKTPTWLNFSTTPSLKDEQPPL
uniref:HAT C-terminal dimerisation domain-containing protein n=1 Tax=Sphaeramia orbicularis TaxID=375764 RepID=A0A672YQ65_9TELE